MEEIGIFEKATESYEIFIPGETIDLVIPSLRAISHDNWHSWFNDPETTRYSNYGLFPNTPKKQNRKLLTTKHLNNRTLCL